MARLLGKDKLFILSIIFYLIGIFAYAIAEYFHEKNSLIQKIDEQLLETVSITVNLLQQELRDNIAGELKAPTPDEDYILSLKLKQIADNMQVADIYSLVQSEEDYVFIAATREIAGFIAEAKNNFDMVFFKNYGNVSEVLATALKTQQIAFDQYDLKEGPVRSIYFPFESVTSKQYLIAVNARIDDINEIVYTSVLKAIAYGLFLGLLAFPLILLYLRKIHQSYQEAIDANLKDTLTNLPNKRRLQQVIKEDGTDQLLFIEIENFDRLSSTLGVITSDSLILKVAYLLKELEIDGIDHCQLFHIENNQFAFHTNHYFSEDDTRNIISGTYKRLTDRNIWQEEKDAVPLVVRMSAVRHQKNILMLASMALIHAQETNQALVIYEPSLNLPEHYQKYIKVFNLLSDALQHERLNIYYQPVLDYKEGRIVHYEALARITDNEGRIVSSPDEFMPIAYQSRLCHKLTRVVLDKVIEEIKGTQHVVSINLSIKDLFDAATRNAIVARIRESGIGHQIEFELQEQQMISQYNLAAAYIRQLKSCNVEIGLDDLGKLYSNFDRLLGLPLSFVKIDGLVVEAIEQDSDARAMVEGVVNFANQKGIKVIAEHCYNQAICDMVATLEVRYMQGFHIGKPAKSIEMIGVI